MLYVMFVLCTIYNILVILHARYMQLLSANPSWSIRPGTGIDD